MQLLKREKSFPRTGEKRSPFSENVEPRALTGDEEGTSDTSVILAEVEPHTPDPIIDKTLPIQLRRYITLSLFEEGHLERIAPNIVEKR